jgi:hypothetical protein
MPVSRSRPKESACAAELDWTSRGRVSDREGGMDCSSNIFNYENKVPMVVKVKVQLRATWGGTGGIPVA